MSNISQEPEQDVPINPTTPKKTIKPVIFISVVIIIWILLCMGSVAFLTIASLCKVMAEKAPIESVLDSFMKSMQVKDTDRAYTFFLCALKTADTLI
ncbi:hypothetical protein ADN00_09810 [Ornatilinea apprima]|uniref:Uncharacterized protein n=1 Tax=Ornatilinea apprima TaxID=1134406 RepID=A0A0P6XL23_9CHLR|nr:hypothetical protein [Ornatilinea apprima]KPL76888.1 hypothetical protein ADN00_09810 [Ornatilinea apprima]